MHDIHVFAPVFMSMLYVSYVCRKSACEEKTTKYIDGEKTMRIRRELKKLIDEHGQFMPNTSKTQLPQPCWSDVLSYIENAGKFTCSYTHFSRIRCEVEFKDIICTKYKGMAKCNECVKIKDAIQQNQHNRDKREELIAERTRHFYDAREHRRKFWKHIFKQQ